MNGHGIETLRYALDALTDERPPPRAGRRSRSRSEESFPPPPPPAWLDDASIQGVGIGYKESGGERTDELVLKVFVNEKRPPDEVLNPVPSFVAVPGVEEPVPTDVVGVGRIELAANRQRVRPPVPGFLIGCRSDSFGTLGCVVRRLDGDTNRQYILSNAHVIAADGVLPAGTPITQPLEPVVGPQPGDEIAVLEKSHPFAFGGAPNLVDAAIARALGPIDVEIKDIGAPIGFRTEVALDEPLQKTGAITDHQVGRVLGIDVRKVELEYRRPGGGKGRVRFRDQIFFAAPTIRGDSGSAVLGMDRRVVGLLFAGSPQVSVCNRIGHVLNLLNIDIWT
ncbi:MAG TPA: hypothetical protein VFX98_05895 [Longimicrobiaceae bacterium]|nr:hypothetical protein [Longimicrobiaceae bacterium]